MSLYADGQTLQLTRCHLNSALAELTADEQDKLIEEAQLMDHSREELRRVGAARRQRAQGAKHEALQSSLMAIDANLAQWSDEFVFGQVWTDSDLAWREQMLVAITALAALGHHAQLRNYLHGAFQGGIEESALRHALSMLTVYAGFPVAIQALNVLREVVARELSAAAADTAPQRIVAFCAGMLTRLFERRQPT
ncbi:carboxymuconolactone decarboxylase family protein [Mycobacterium sp. CVI_P3]|uniref:Carboxymuconolactone decarboxylase family protein n=1 Tax=Mycobacterium pinniadriaticum TaxID=2994102 RepID=A0ABT3SN18_9MYCO|nr:carboxymuconolactone decarboxylase family protein [Mycobacterium pinniadriaticum]MCX2934430.1 carboxymuconolactone decarboxylase family protein [Mycobacterium pinniadriaticum]MCX2940853.1 carboxymuconolactone decarboxylase family protein [Mycobacterium pinniadriaticum]